MKNGDVTDAANPQEAATYELPLRDVSRETSLSTREKSFDTSPSCIRTSSAVETSDVQCWKRVVATKKVEEAEGHG